MPCYPTVTLCTAGILLAAIGAAPAGAQETSAIAVPDYTVFVDPPTAFAFIKLPTGWKFVGKLDREQLRHLPPGTVTSLLPQEDDGVSLAEKTPSPAVRRTARQP
jgi:hypothetical protein